MKVYLKKFASVLLVFCLSFLPYSANAQLLEDLIDEIPTEEEIILEVQNEAIDAIRDMLYGSDEYQSGGYPPHSLSGLPGDPFRGTPLSPSGGSCYLPNPGSRLGVDVSFWGAECEYSYEATEGNWFINCGIGLDLDLDNFEPEDLADLHDRCNASGSIGAGYSNGNDFSCGFEVDGNTDLGDGSDVEVQFRFNIYFEF